MILRVTPNDIAGLWDQVEPLVTSALRASVTHDAGDVRADLLLGKAALFIQHTEQVDGIAVTNFAGYPKGLWLRIWLVATRPGVPLDGAGFYATCEHWRKIHQCKGFEVCSGRKGWLNHIEGAELRLEGCNFRSVKN